MTPMPSPTSDDPPRLVEILESLPADRRALAESLMRSKPGDVANERIARQQAERERQERIETRLRQFFDDRGLDYESCDFSTFDIARQSEGRAERANVLERCRYLCEAEDGLVLDEHIRRGGNVFLHGSPGTGKDHLLTAMLRQVLTRTAYSVKWTTGPDLVQSFRDAIDSKTSEANAVYAWCKPRVLAISDLIVEGAELNQHQRGKLYQVLDYRSSHRLGTWVTVNVMMKATLMESIGASLVDRLCQRSLRLAFNWPSYRNPDADWLNPNYWDKRRHNDAERADGSGILPFAKEALG